MVIKVSELGRTSRVPRFPKHNWQIRQQPYVIQPLCIAPVLAGETLKNMVMQARVVTDPIKNPLIGWWIEYYWFYIKLRDLDDREEITQMLIDPSVDGSSIQYWVGGESEMLYYDQNGPNWSQMCLNRVVDEYFRDSGETWSDHLIGNMPLAQISGQSWQDTMATAATYETQDFDVDTDSSGTIEASEVALAHEQWEFLRAQNMTQMTYEDYLGTFGIRQAPEEVHKPELIRFIRDWTYPSNTIDPSDGSPSSACSWAVSERIDKDRFFKEPGFVFGCTVCRPKAYLTKQVASASTLMDDSYAWLPALLRDDPATSLKQIETAANSLVPGAPDGYWMDVRDLFIYGDQFINFDIVTAADGNGLALPVDTTMQRRFASQADITALFVGSDTLVRQDGVSRFTILGTQTDTTPRGRPRGVTV